MIRGSTDSDDDVPRTMRISSPMCLRNFSRLKPTVAAIDAEDDEDEHETGQVDRRHQLAERQQRADAVAAHGERHRAECAERREPHDERDNLEQHLRDRGEERDERGRRRRRGRASPGRTAPTRAAPGESRPS